MIVIKPYKALWKWSRKICWGKLRGKCHKSSHKRIYSCSYLLQV